MGFLPCLGKGAPDRAIAVENVMILMHPVAAFAGTLGAAKDRGLAYGVEWGLNFSLPGRVPNAYRLLTAGEITDDF
jgi:hypothetical protein